MPSANAIGSVTLSPLFMRTECRRRGWNQEELARQTGLSRGTVSVAYRGGTITPRTAVRIQAAFDRVRPTLDGILSESGLSA